jgi:hypothetical protein
MENLSTAGATPWVFVESNASYPSIPPLQAISTNYEGYDLIEANSGISSLDTNLNFDYNVAQYSFDEEFSLTHAPVEFTDPFALDAGSPGADLFDPTTTSAVDEASFMEQYFDFE